MDDLFTNLDDPRRQALLMMAAGLLSPVRGKGMAGFGEAMSRGIEGGLLGFNQAATSKRQKERDDIQKQMLNLQLGNAKSEQDFNSRRDALAKNFFEAPAPSVPYNDTLGNQPPQANIPGSPGKADLSGYAAALPSLGGKGVTEAIQIQQALQKDNLFGKIDPKDYTPESIRQYAQTRDPAVLVPVRPVDYQDVGGSVVPVNRYAPNPQPLTKSLTPADQQRIPLERTNTAVTVARAQDEGIPVPGVPSAPSVGAPSAPGAGMPPGVPGLSAKQQRELLGKQAGERAAATSAFPQVEAEARQTMGLIDKLVSHPGFSTVVGSKGVTGVPAAMGYPIPGTDAADFVVLRNQLVGKQFLQAYETLKGSGQITEIEGKKATDAIARMDTSQSEKEFKSAAAEFRSVIEAGLNRARAKAGVAEPQDTRTVVIDGRQFEARRGKHGKFYVQMGNKFYEVSE